METINFEQIFKNDKSAPTAIIKKAESLANQNSVDLNKMFLGVGHIGKPDDPNTFFYACDHDTGTLLKCYDGKKLESHRNRKLDSTYKPKLYNHWISFNEFRDLCFAWQNGA